MNEPDGISAIPDSRKAAFTLPGAVQRMNSLKVAVFDDAALVRIGPAPFPRAEVVSIDPEGAHRLEKDRRIFYILQSMLFDHTVWKQVTVEP